MSKRLLSIVGPTASGKTKLALALAEKLLASRIVAGVDLISADSRQVYGGLEIISGATDQDSSKLKTQDLKLGKMQFYGLSLIKPDEEWSVAHFQKLAQNIMKQSWSQQRLPIVVGGTGLYQTKLLTLDKQILLKPNLKLRTKLNQLAISDLQQKLKQLDKPKFDQLNSSDKVNPRRLIRAIEIALAKPSDLIQSKIQWQQPDKQLTLGIKVLLSQLKEKIAQRVEQRFAFGAVTEVERLLINYPNLNLPAKSATGIKEIAAYLAGEIDKKTCLKLWLTREYQYAKRQMTWWRKYQPDFWLSGSTEQLISQALRLVNRWLAN